LSEIEIHPSKWVSPAALSTGPADGGRPEGKASGPHRPPSKDLGTSMEQRDGRGIIKP
jgi:hypothetical protein